MVPRPTYRSDTAMELNTTLRLASVIITLVISGCESISILTPASNSTTIPPVTTDVFWNAYLQPGNFKRPASASQAFSGRLEYKSEPRRDQQ